MSSSTIEIVSPVLVALVGSLGYFFGRRKIRSEAAKNEGEAVTFITQASMDAIAKWREIYDEMEERWMHAQARSTQLEESLSRTNDALDKAQRKIAELTEQIEHLQTVAEEHGVPPSAWRT